MRDLAAIIRPRIELKQIGVRDEAKRLDGVGRCGRQYCSAAWLPELRPVNLGVAKDQRLSLNPSQISGACGRLMCSLRYEHDFYVQSRKRFPKEGRIIATSRGEEKIVANDIFNDRVVLRTADGESRTVALAELKRELGDLATAQGRRPAGLLDDAGESAVPGAVPDLGTTAVPPGGDLGVLPAGADSVEAVLAAAAAADGEVPVSLPIERTDARPPRPLREPDRRAGTPSSDLEAVAPPDATLAESDVESEEEDHEEGATTPDAATPGAADDDRRPRRRRGRRGGRRGRGSGQQGSTGGTTAGSESGE